MFSLAISVHERHAGLLTRNLIRWAFPQILAIQRALENAGAGVA